MNAKIPVPVAFECPQVPMAPLDEILVMVVQEVECKERHQVNGGQVPPELDISVAYLRYGIYAFVEM